MAKTRAWRRGWEPCPVAPQTGGPCSRQKTAQFPQTRGRHCLRRRGVGCRACASMSPCWRGAVFWGTSGCVPSSFEPRGSLCLTSTSLAWMPKWEHRAVPGRGARACGHRLGVAGGGLGRTGAGWGQRAEQARGRARTAGQAVVPVGSTLPCVRAPKHSHLGGELLAPQSPCGRRTASRRQGP